MTRRPAALLLVVAVVVVAGLAWRVLTAGAAATPRRETVAVVNAHVSAPGPAPEVSVPATRDTPGEAVPPERTEQQAFVVMGRVLRAADSRALRGVTVEWLEARRADGTERVLASVVTADDGVFRLVGSAARPVALRCEWRAWRELLREGSATCEPIPRAPVTRRVELPAGGSMPVDLVIKLDTGWTLAGQVRDGQERPVEGAFVIVGKYGPEARTRLDGRYVVHDIEHTSAPRVDVTASAAFRRDQVVSVEPPAESNGQALLDFTLLPAGEVYGFVVTHEGFSVPAATVSALVPGASDRSDAGDIVAATTDSSGRYELAGLPRGVFTLVCTWMHHTPGTKAAQDVRRTASAFDVPADPDIATRRDFRLGAGVTLSGRVLGTSGTPIGKGHDVQLWSVTGTGPSARLILLDARVPLNAAGEFELTGLHPGPKALHVVGPESGDMHLWRTMLTRPHPPAGSAQPAPSAAEVLQDSLRRVERSWRLELAPEGLRGLELIYARRADAAGNVVDERGRPIEDVTVEPICNVREPGTEVTGKEGGFRVWSTNIEGLLALRFTHPEFLSRVIDLPEGESARDLCQVVLTRAPALRLAIVDAESGEPLPSASVTWHLSGGGRRDAVQHIVEAGSEPIALRSDRSDGDWVLTVQASGHRPWRRTSTLVGGDDPESVTVRLQRE